MITYVLAEQEIHTTYDTCSLADFIFQSFIIVAEPVRKRDYRRDGSCLDDQKLLLVLLLYQSCSAYIIKHTICQMTMTL